MSRTAAKGWTGLAAMALPIAAALIAALPTAAAAQDAQREEVDRLVADWAAGAQGHSPQIVRYTRNCVVDEVMAMAEAPRAVIIDAGDFAEGLATLQDTDQESLGALLPGIDACVQVMDLGEPVYDWIAETYPELRLLERDPLADCLLDVLRPRSPIARHIIELGDDFPHGVAVAAITVPVDTAGLEEAIAACQP